MEAAMICSLQGYLGHRLLDAGMVVRKWERKLKLPHYLGFVWLEKKIEATKLFVRLRVSDLGRGVGQLDFEQKGESNP